MPSEKSARSAVRRQIQNQATRSAVKTTVRAARRSITAASLEEATRSTAKTNVRAARRSVAKASLEEAEAAVLQAISSLDRATKRGALHVNNASRRKSRLAKHLSTLRAGDSTSQ